MTEVEGEPVEIQVRAVELVTRCREEMVGFAVWAV